jgi:hypothetical protein
MLCHAAGPKDSHVILSILLLCGVAASLALGVLLAYALCVSMFALFRIQTRKAATARLAASVALQTAPN